MFPLLQGSSRDAATVIIVTTGAAALWCDLWHRRGGHRAVITLCGITVMAFAAEAIGTTTGFPFGSYSYATDRIGLQACGVPLIISLAWFTGTLSVWRVSSLLSLAVPGRIVMSIIAMVGWDLYLDPQMVKEKLWLWHTGIPGLPGIPDVPYTNYAGWTLLSIMIFGALAVLDPGQTNPSEISMVTIGITWFVWTWLGSAIAQTVFLPGLADGVLWGFAFMGILGAQAIWNIRLGRRAPNAARPDGTRQR